MPANVKVPILRNSNIVVRLADDANEIARANRLVYRNYVDDGFWSDDRTQLKTNPFLHTPWRTVFVMFDGETLIGTMSMIRDSTNGLPSDGTQSKLIAKLRRPNMLLAEVSAFAMDRTTSSRRLVLFLVSYAMQYGYYYLGIDQLIASCTPEHARFYQTILGFTKVSDLTYYDYSHATGYLLNFDLANGHRTLAAKYPPDSKTGQSFYRFLLCDPQPCHVFSPAPMMRARPMPGGRANKKFDLATMGDNCYS